jgi:TolB-like protein/lipopolysaccharide biosynthesis regulator YciM
VTELPLNCRSEHNQKAVREQLDRILKSGPFLQSQRRQRFLEYIVNETLAGRGERLKGYNVARDVFDRAEGFDPNVDPIVRIEAARVRDKLREYYEADGQSDPIRIDLPKGSYTPHIEFRQPPIPEPQPEQSDATTPDQHLNPMQAPVAPMDERPLSAPPWLKRLIRWQMAVPALALLLVLGAVGAWRWSSRSVSPLSEKASIAVLPFENIGNDSKWDHFADGITEDIVTDLSHSRDLFVVARNSTEVYKGKPADVRNVGRDLGVHYALVGSVQPSGAQIRVTAQLIDARTGGYVWSKKYDRPATDLFKVQSDVTENIAATLTGYEGAVAEAERSLIRRKPPSDLTAYEFYLLGMEAKHKVTKEGLDEGERLFRKALEIDPQLARAYVGLAAIYEYRLEFGLGTSVADNSAKQMEAARNAVRLDPNDGETQLVLGHAFAYQGMADQALEQFAKAEALAPNNADLLILIAWYLPQLGQPERAVKLIEKALQLNPNYPYWYNQGLRYVYFFGRQFDKSVKYTKLVTDPFAEDYAYLAAASAMTDDMVGAKVAAAELVRLDPNWSVEKYFSDQGGYPENVAVVLIEGARKAGVAACVPADKLSSIPNLVHVKKCDEGRTHQSAG